MHYVHQYHEEVEDFYFLGDRPKPKRRNGNGKKWSHDPRSKRRRTGFSNGLTRRCICIHLDMQMRAEQKRAPLDDPYDWLEQAEDLKAEREETEMVNELALDVQSSEEEPRVLLFLIEVIKELIEADHFSEENITRLKALQKYTERKLKYSFEDQQEEAA